MSTNKLPHPLSQIDRADQLCRTLKCGENLFVQGGATAGLYYLIKGTIDLKRVTSAGHSVLIHRACSGQTFAEASLFSASYHCTATAVSDAKVVECRRTIMLDLFSRNIEFSTSMAARFASQIQENRRRVELLSIRAADERILAALTDGLLVGDISTFADTIGLAPETVYRTLSRLSQIGKIQKTERGQYHINTDPIA